MASTQEQKKSSPKKRSKSRSRSKKNRFLVPGLILGAAVCLALGMMLGMGVAFRIDDPLVITQPPETQQTLPPNPYSPSDFSYNELGLLTCSDPDVRMGIDVSDHQGWIDWQQVAQAGVEFAFIRIGYRGYSEGGIFQDEYAHYNLTAARDAGIEIGVYFYSQAVNEEEAAEEAAWCLELLEDYEIDLPVVFDWEYVSAEARTGSMDPETLTRCAQIFCNTVISRGYQAMVYFNPHLAQDYYHLLHLQHYPFWLAMYTSEMDYPHRVDYWQYTDQGTLPGIDTPVDINLKLS